MLKSCALSWFTGCSYQRNFWRRESSKVALVTGGARGIGRATARLLAQRGAAVCVNYAAHADAADRLAAAVTAATLQRQVHSF